MIVKYAHPVKITTMSNAKATNDFIFSIEICSNGFELIDIGLITTSFNMFKKFETTI